MTTATVSVVEEVVAAQVTMTTEAVAGSTAVPPVEVVVPAKAAMTTEVVTEAEAKTTNDVAELSIIVLKRKSLRTFPQAPKEKLPTLSSPKKKRRRVP